MGRPQARLLKKGRMESGYSFLGLHLRRVSLSHSALNRVLHDKLHEMWLQDSQGSRSLAGAVTPSGAPARTETAQLWTNALPARGWA